METVKLASLVEALLFAQGNSISIDKLCEIFEVGKKELKAAVALLKESMTKKILVSNLLNLRIIYSLQLKHLHMII